MSTIFLSSPDVGELEQRFAMDALSSGWVAPLGPHVDAFEAEMAQRVGADHAVAVGSGTAALHLALVSWGVGPGDMVPTSSMTFAATANAIVYTGATPVLIDSEPTTGNLDPGLLDHAITELLAHGHRVPAIVPVDLLGACVDHAAIGEIAARHGVRVLADSAESLGSSRAGVAAGGWGDAAVLSFNGNKIMTTSGGGMLMTSDRGLAEHARFLSTQAREPAVHYEHREIGYNYRLSNVLAAIGRAQLQRLDEMITRRRDVRAGYRALFADVPGVRVFGAGDDSHDNCWLTAIVVDPAEAGWAGDDLRRALEAADIESRPLWKPMHLQPVHAGRPAYVNGVAERLFERGLSLPSGSNMTAEQRERVLTTIQMFLGAR